MPELKRCFEGAGFTNVRTILSSGNVAFDARSASEGSIERKAESSMQELLGRTFYTIVRQANSLVELLETDPFAAYAVPTSAKRVISFLRISRVEMMPNPVLNTDVPRAALRTSPQVAG
jgi:uncharacterized protein (DUF1697 family)